MTGKLIAAVVAGLVLGVAGTSLFVNQPEARGQQKEKQPQWEYKVILASAEAKDAAKVMTEQYNALAAEGWEYVGPVVDSTHARALNGPYSGIGGAFILFKRPK
jgi:hypothetical protein